MPEKNVIDLATYRAKKTKTEKRLDELADAVTEKMNALAERITAELASDEPSTDGILDLIRDVQNAVREFDEA